MTGIQSTATEDVTASGIRETSHHTDGCHCMAYHQITGPWALFWGIENRNGDHIPTEYKHKIIKHKTRLDMSPFTPARIGPLDMIHPGFRI